ncbi:hypothetical protein NDU88_000238 [Pleurodeles waltl]|uniref:Uncharacterized protein n=1 Tax=Pleurodeles waltl TaxID=8319 RepID=A0AAV7P3M1_PLEWA|nr:hypothetical protein NDU88_000238 [Pleurodeles waltl]
MDHQGSIRLIKVEKSDDSSSSNSWSSDDWMKDEIEEESKDYPFFNKPMKMQEWEEASADDYEDELCIVKVEDEEIPIEYCQVSKNHWKNEGEEKPPNREPQDFMKCKDGEEGFATDPQDSVEEWRIQNSTEGTQKKRSSRKEGPTPATEQVTKEWAGNARWGFSNMLQKIDTVNSSAWLKEKLPDYNEKETTPRIQELGMEKSPECKSDICHPVDLILRQRLQRSKTHDECGSNAGSETSLNCKQSTQETVIQKQPDGPPAALDHDNMSVILV